MTQVGGYARISDDVSGSGLGVARQEADDRSLAALRGWELAEMYVDNDLSAYKRDVVRPAFERMLADLQAGTIDGLVAYDLDRLARQPVDLERLIAIYDARPGLRFATVQGDIDLQSADGRTLARVMVAFANKSSMDTARRVRRKHLELAQAGVPVGGTRPFGWRKDHSLDPRESRLVREAVDYLLAGGHLHAVVRRWNEAGIRTTRGNEWRTATLRQMLLSPRVAGWRVHRGQIATGTDGAPVRGQHEQLLEDETWERLCAKLRLPERLPGAAHRGGRRPKYLLTGIVRCASCSSTLRGNAGRSPGTFYYVCDKTSGGCGKVAISGRELDRLVSDLVLAHLGRLALPAEADTWVGEDELAEVEQRAAEVMEAYTAGRLSAARAFPAIEKLEDEAAALREERGIWAAQRERVAERPSDVAATWPGMSTEDRRAVVRSVLRTVVVRRAAHRGGRFDPSRAEAVWR